MAHDDMGTAFGCMQQAIAGIGETLCLEHASLLKVRENDLSSPRLLLGWPPHNLRVLHLRVVVVHWLAHQGTRRSR